jgi:hypothetical protein
MNAMPHLLLITALSIPTSTLVLRSGVRIDVGGSVRQEEGRIYFRSSGTLYSVPSDEVDLAATRAAGSTVTVSEARVGKLKVSGEERERLLRELEQNHSGKPAPNYPSALAVLPAPATTERPQTTEDEWSWRRQTRSYEEGIRRAQENRDLLVDRAAQLRNHIASLLSLGYRPSQFSYDTTVLAYTIEQIPAAELEIERAQRAYTQFRDDARRQGVPPGWLR